MRWPLSSILFEDIGAVEVFNYYYFLIIIIIIIISIIKLKQVPRHTDVETVFYCVGRKYG